MAAKERSPFDAFSVALGDVDNLLDRHPKAKDPTRGRPSSNEGPLLRASLLLVYAAWEVYVEDALLWAIGSLVGGLSPEQLPPATRRFVENSKAGPWELAGENWRKTTIAAVEARVRGGAGGSFGLNTAGPEQVVRLYEDVLGSSPLGKCSWQGAKNAYVKRELANLVSIRGEIAHTGQTPGPLTLAGARSWRDFVGRLATTHDARLTRWVNEKLET